MVVANLYQLAQMHGKFTKEHKTLIREKVVVAETFLERTNKNWEDSGKFYEVDKEATKEWKAAFKAKKEANKEADEIQEEGTKAIQEAVKSAAKGKK